MIPYITIFPTDKGRQNNYRTIDMRFIPNKIRKGERFYTMPTAAYIEDRFCDNGIIVFDFAKFTDEDISFLRSCSFVYALLRTNKDTIVALFGNGTEYSYAGMFKVIAKYLRNSGLKHKAMQFPRPCYVFTEVLHYNYDFRLWIDTK